MQLDFCFFVAFVHLVVYLLLVSRCRIILGFRWDELKRFLMVVDERLVHRLQTTLKQTRENDINLFNQLP